jgi:hypothetical protein
VCLKQLSRIRLCGAENNSGADEKVGDFHIAEPSMSPAKHILLNQSGDYKLAW